jgi:hypothetical protein
MAQSSEMMTRSGMVRRSMAVEFLYRAGPNQVTSGHCVLYVEKVKKLRVVCG